MPHNPYEYIIASDIHNNYKNLKRLLTNYKKSIDNIFLLGDIVNKNYSPLAEKTLNQLSSKGIIACYGNHDLEFFKKYKQNLKENKLSTSYTLSLENYNYLDRLPEHVYFHGFLCIHDPRPGKRKLKELVDAKESFDFLEQKFSDLFVCFSGHYHQKLAFKMNKSTKEIVKVNEENFTLHSDDIYLVNPGSLGFFGDYIIYDTISNRVRRQNLNDSLNG